MLESSLRYDYTLPVPAASEWGYNGAHFHLGPENSRHLVYNDFGSDVLAAMAERGFEASVPPFDRPGSEMARILTFVGRKPLRS